MKSDLNVKKGYTEVLNAIFCECEYNRIILEQLYNLDEDEFYKRIDHMVNLINSERQREIIKYKYGICGYEKKSYKEIADIFNITTTTVSSLSQKIIYQFKALNYRHKILIKDYTVNEPICNLNLSTRTYNILMRNGIWTVPDLKKLCDDPNNMSKIYGISKGTIKEIYEKLNLNHK